MAFENVWMRLEGVESTGDLSNNQFDLVALTGDNEVSLCGLTQSAIGILGNKPTTAGQAADVAVNGRSKVNVLVNAAAGAGPVAAGDALMAATAAVGNVAGRAVLAASGARAFGVALEGTPADDGVYIVTCHLDQFMVP